MRLRRWVRAFTMRDERGAALVEFALIVPLFLLMFFAVFDFAFLLYNRHALVAAVREGGRFAAVLPALAEDDARVQGRTGTAFNGTRVLDAELDGADVDVDPPTAANSYVVTVTVPTGAIVYEPFSPIGEILGLGEISLVARASFRWELAPDTP